jgi:hypothetical protein
MGDVGATANAAVDLGLGTAQLILQEQELKRARERETELRGKLDEIENGRMKVINPYESIEDLSDDITDLSGIKSNTFDNMGVATQAAEFQAEQNDISLANTLDTLQASGASAGGATALAQAALAGKKGVSASIEKQEARNQEFKAKGEEALQNTKLAEAQRVQAGQFGEAQRLQNAGVLGQEFVYGENERRDTNDLNRYTSLITGTQAAQADARKGSADALGNMSRGASDLYGSFKDKASKVDNRPSSDFSRFTEQKPGKINTENVYLKQ